MQKPEKDWVSKIERLARLVLPKFSNRVAWLLIRTGLVICAVTVPVSYYVILQVAEVLVGKDLDVIQDFLDSNSSPWLGLTILFAGLGYHLVMELSEKALEHFALSRAEAKQPEFELSLLDHEWKRFEAAPQALGERLLKPKGRLPDYEGKQKPGEKEADSLLGGRLYAHPINFTYPIKDYLRQLAQHLHENAGTLLFYIRLKNISNNRADKIAVKLKLQSGGALRVLESIDKLYPPTSEKNSLDTLGPMQPRVQINPAIEKINDSEGAYLWATVGELHSGTAWEPDCLVQARPEIHDVLEVEVYAEGFNESKKYMFEIRGVPEKELTVNDFENPEMMRARALKCVMNGEPLKADYIRKMENWH